MSHKAVLLLQRNKPMNFLTQNSPRASSLAKF